ncbi:HIT domain-containing protein [Candidatus Woesearchaeota archaeon]|nr:HIT domain-containing protein [Candidatus Woesearchaeota archaeon]
MPSETQEELMERVKKMTPEELLEFQKNRCIFCQIIAGKVQSKKIYEDDKVFAILDINPANPGHILLMPKEHYAIMPQVPEDILGHLSTITKKICNIALKALGAKGTNVLIQNGVAAGQKSQHFMIHIIPRMENDGIGLFLDRKQITENDYNTVKGRLSSKVNEIFGIEPDVKEADIINETVKDIEDADKELAKENEEIEKLQKEIEGEKESERKPQPETEKEKKELENPKEEAKDEDKDDDAESNTPVEEEDSDDDDDSGDNGTNLDDIAKVLGVR